MSILENIESPLDLKKLTVEELSGLGSELRDFIVSTVSKTGGHLASSLGAVELTMALHYALDTPKDKIIWDVGHQAYAHKLLTGRRDEFSTLRQYHGVSGFPKPSESPYDTVIAGHAATSISVGLGMAVARDLQGDDYRVVSVIGDGSMTAGLAFEGLNQAGHLDTDIVVILNDNEMSISKNVGALSSFLSRKITGSFATKFKNDFEGFVHSIPGVGSRLSRIVKRAEDSLITFFTPGMLFEGLGFHYVGPIDGHDAAKLIEKLEETKAVKGPVLLHVMTKKGKGYAPAESNPSKFHGIGPFDELTGETKKSTKLTYTGVFSSTLLEMAEQHENVVAITAAMPEGTGLSEFAKRFPERFFDVGIAEQHAITFAAGIAKQGFIPVTAIYSTFMQRAYDQLFHDVCLENLSVIIALDRGGLVGADGPTHHGVFDLSYLRHLPNMVVAAPKDEVELRDMFFSALSYKCPVAIRYPRGTCPGSGLEGEVSDIPKGQAEVLREGPDVTIIAIGVMVYPALEAALMLEKSGINAGVINARFVKPLDEECILKLAGATGKVLTVEENALQGGFGSAVLELISDSGLGGACIVKRLGIPDRFIEHGTQAELRSELGLTATGIEKAVRDLFESGETGKAANIAVS